jgi:hypothetical protein
MEKFVPFIFLVAFPLMWIGISFLISRIGGWSSLAKHYRDDQVRDLTHLAEEVTWYRMRSVSMGISNYSSCVTLGASKTGLRLSVMFLFRVGHPPLFIPWSEFHSVRKKGILFFSMLDTYVGMPVVANVALPKCIQPHIPASIEIRE